MVDLAVRVYERDRDSAGTVLGSAIAFRLFLFFVPLLLFVVGLAGFFGEVVSAEDVDDAGIAGTLAAQIGTALEQPTSTRWIAIAAGLVGIATTGRTLAKSLVQASCLGWRMPMRSKAPVRVVGALIGLLVGMGLIATIVNRIRQDLGLAVTWCLIRSRPGRVRRCRLDPGGAAAPPHVGSRCAAARGGPGGRHPGGAAGAEPAVPPGPLRPEPRRSTGSSGQRSSSSAGSSSPAG